MAETLSLFLTRSSPIHRLYPLTKLVLAGLMLFAGLLLPGWYLYVFIGLVVIPLAAMARVLRNLSLSTLRVVLPFAISVFLIQGFLWPGGTPLVGIGFISLKREGLAFAINSTGRILLVVSGFLWLAFTTRPDMLMFTLVQRGLPSSLSYILVTTLQIVPRFQARAAAILDAQQARGLRISGNLVQRGRALLPLIKPLVLSSLIDVEERALGIEAKGFNHPGKKTSLIEITEERWEPALRWCTLGAGVALLGLRIWLR